MKDTPAKKSMANQRKEHNA